MINVRDRGAVGDGKTLDSPAINDAIQEAAACGGGQVVVPSGIYRCGTIFLASNIDLHLEPGAVIQGSHNIADYPAQDQEVDTKDANVHHLIIAHDCKNVSLTGRGVIDGQGFAFWEPQESPRAWIRHRMPRVSPCVEISDCEDVAIEDITLHESPGWTLHLRCCDRVRIRGVRIDNNRFGPNNDGFDINGCHDVMISDCHIDTCDDAIVMKTTRKARSCERITITNCVLSCNCAAVKCGTESFHDFRQIVVSNCVVTRSTRAFACYAFDGGTVEQIRVANIVCDTDIAFIFNHPLHLDARKRNDESKLSTIRDIRVSNFSARTDGRILLTAAEGTTIEDVDFDGIGLDYALFCDPARYAEGSTGHQVSRHSPEARAAQAAVVLENVKRFRLTGFTVKWPSSIDSPGWGESAPRIENGGTRILGPADKGDDVAFSALWASGCEDCEVDLSTVQASDDRAERTVIDHCTGMRL